MLYRVLLGIIPMLLAALFLTGAIPLGSVLPTTEYRSAKAGLPEDRTGAAGQPAPRGAGIPDAMAPTPQAATELFDAIDADLDAEIKRRAPAEKASKERLQRERLRESHGSTWSPSGGGWGS